MTYYYYLEVAAFIICSLLAIDITSKHQLYRLDSRFFMHAIRAQGALSLIDALSCIALDHTDTVPYSVNIGLCIAYFVLQGLTLALLILFVLSYPEHSLRNTNGYIFIAAGIMTISVILSAITPWTGLLFKISPDGTYTHGPLRIIFYIFYLIVGAFIIFFELTKRRLLMPRERHALAWSGVVILSATTLQMTSNASLILGLATSIAFLLYYIALENPDTYIDKRTACNNHESLRMFIGEWNPSRDKYAIEIVRIHQLDTLAVQYGRDTALQLFQSLATFLKSIAGVKNVFCADDQTLIIVKKGDMSVLQTYEQQIVERFTEPWKLSDGGLVTIEKQTAMFEYPQHFDSFPAYVEMLYHMISLLGPKSGVLLQADEQIIGQKKRTRAVEEALKHALSSETLEVYYQPIFDDNSRTIVSLEALSRLNDPLLGFIPPDEFVSVAEDTGLIYDMGIYVFKKVCRFINTGLMRMKDCPVRAVEINLSPLQLINPKTIPTFRQVMTHYDIPGDMLNFEVTESATVTSPDKLRTAMDELKELGCKFSLDDYGTGFSNISYMVQFPFDFIKFDKSLIWSYFKEPAARIIMQGEFDIITTLGKDIIAEGIEKKEFIEDLRNQNVRFYQGFYFSKAIPERELLVYLEAPLPET